MPAQKRSSDDDLEEESLVEDKVVVQVKDDDEEDDDEVQAEEEPEAVADGVDGEPEEPEEDDEEEEEDDDEESDETRSSKDGDNDEYILVNLAEIRKEVQCPICLGIIRKTRTVMECLHRFCRECIDKSMRMGNNECPACRTHCASRRSLRDDPNYDALIAALYQDIDKYEAEELAFREEEKTRNKQIQASIAQTFQRQTEALGRKRTTAKAVAAFMRRTRGRRRGRNSRNSRGIELQGSEDEEDGNGNDGGRDSSSADERSTDVKSSSKRFKRWSGSGGGPRYSQSSAIDVDGGCDGNDEVEVSRESIVASPGLISSPEVLAWGKGGVRSHTRYGSITYNGKNSRNRMAKLVDHFKNPEENIDKLDTHLIVVPVDRQTIPSLDEPFLCCKPTLSVGHLCQFVALQTPFKAEDVEILVVDPQYVGLYMDGSDSSSLKVDFNKDKLYPVREQVSLAELLANNLIFNGILILAYRQKIAS
ncbi:RING-type E3 ubiquitin transferase [Ranunculus cassubicifolius]